MRGWMRAGLLGLCLSLSAFAAAPARAATRTLVVGVEDQDYRPAYGWHDGAFAGAARQILDAYAADRGLHFDYRPLPVKRLFSELVHHDIDLKFPDNPAWWSALKRGHHVVYSHPVIRYTDGVMVPAAKRAEGVGAIHVLGTVAGFTPSGWSDRVRSGAVTLKETPRAELTVAQTLRGLIDGAYVSVAAANRILAEMGRPRALVFDAALPHANGAYLLSSGSHPELVADFDSWLAANAGRVQAIIARTGAERGVEK